MSDLEVLYLRDKIARFIVELKTQLEETDSRNRRTLDWVIRKIERILGD